MTNLAEDIVARERDFADAKETLKRAEALEPFRQRRQALPALAEQSALSRYVREAATQKRAAVEKLKADLGKAEQLYEKTVTATPLTRLLRGLPKSEVQLRIVEQSRAQLSLAEAAANTLAENAKEAESILREIQELEDGIALYSDIPQPQKQRQIAESLESKLQALKQQRKQRWPQRFSGESSPRVARIELQQ